ncbi:MAG TPA: DUF3307 domain-containing protein, partial [Bacillota bacterium]|nr:DUF3307 domain-containing protein [Bacillota bacterium]
IYSLVVGILVFISHLIIDLVKAAVIRKYPRYLNNIFLFIGDQLVHVIIIFLISWFVDYAATGASALVYGLRQLIHGYYSWQFIISGNRIVLLAIMLLLGIPVAGSFIRMFIGWLKYRPSNEKPSKDIEDTRAKVNDKQGRGDRGSRVFDGGFIIGILERTIIIFSIAVHMEAIVGFLIAVKSIARFKKFEDDVFVEYFIIGSFLSLLIAVVIGFLIREVGLLSTL